MRKLPWRIYVCPICSYSSEYRWALSRHLQQVHGCRKADADGIAAANEYIANPISYQKVRDIEYEEPGENEN